MFLKKIQNKDCKNGEPTIVFDLDPKLIGFNFLKNKKTKTMAFHFYENYNNLKLTVL
jgi:hypothetical protein